jgi:hypothetical protein
MTPGSLTSPTVLSSRSPVHLAGLAMMTERAFYISTTLSTRDAPRAAWGA